MPPKQKTTWDTMVESGKYGFMPPKQKTTWDTMVESGKYGPLAPVAPAPTTTSPTPATTPVSGAITPSTLTPTTTITPVTPPPQTITTPFLDLTPQEKQAETDVRNQQTDITSLIGDLVGENTYRREVSQERDLIGKESAITSYQNQLKSLQNEAQGIDLQLAQTLQSDQAKGGISTFQLSANQQATQRVANQAKLTNAIQQYSLGAQLQAAQGDYATALKYVDQAVALKYQGKKDQLTAAQANLENLLKSPDLTSAEKKRAEAMKTQITAQEKEIAKEEENAKTIQGLALQAQQNGAPAAIIGQIMNAKDITQALVTSAGWTAKETAQSIQEYQFAVRNGYKGSFTQYQNEDANRKVAIARAGVNTSGLSAGEINAFNSIVGKYNSSPLIQAADRVIILKNTIDQIKKDPSNGAQQLNLVYSYIQALDTYQSAVREGELGLVNSIDSKVGQIEGYVQKIQNGQVVRPEVALQIADAASKIVDTINEAAKTKAKSFESQANTVGLGDQWSKYVSGFNSNFNAPKSATVPVGETRTGKDGKTYKKVEGGWVPA